MKFANAIATSNNDIICLYETWLNKNIASSELMLKEYSIYRSERQLASSKFARWSTNGSKTNIFI